MTTHFTDVERLRQLAISYGGFGGNQPLQDLLNRVADRIDPLLEKIKQLERSEELAWGLIANAYGGDWQLASDASGWADAAIRWRDAYYLNAPKSADRDEAIVPENTQ